VIWAGTDDGNVQVTKDGGKTWTNVVANITGLQKTLGVITLAWVLLERNSLCFFEGHATNDYTPYTYKTTDFGKHGNQLLLLILMVLFVTFKKILPMKTYYITEKGLYITIDGGANWSHLPIKCLQLLYTIWN
jgi:hypothetical protein